MIQGKALVEYDNGSAGKEAFVLSAGKALSIDPGSHVCETIDYDDQYFARTINSQESIVWRGESLNLADIAGGGNGFGTGTLNHSIDLISGKSEADTNTVFARPSKYHAITSDVLYVDCVFVPDAKQGPVQISSTGLIFKSCPATDGQYSWDIINGLYEVNPPSKRTTFVLNGKEVSLASHPTLGVHANKGITFNLQEIS